MGSINRKNCSDEPTCRAAVDIGNRLVGTAREGESGKR